MSDAFTDVAKMKKIKEEIKAHEGQVVEMTLENGRKRQKNKFGRLIEVYPSLFIIEYTNDNSLPGTSQYIRGVLHLFRYFNREEFNSLFGLISCFYRLNQLL